MDDACTILPTSVTEVSAIGSLPVPDSTTHGMTLGSVMGRTMNGILHQAARRAVRLILASAGLIATVAVPPHANAADGDCALPAKTRRAVVRIIDGDTLLLDDGSEVGLVGALAPAPPAGDGDWMTWPPAVAARKALEALTHGQSVDIAFEDRQSDRHGRLLAQVFVGEGDGRRWLQGALVAAGHARAFSHVRSRGCARALIARETAARRAKLGLWGNAAYAVREAWRTRDLLRAVQTYQIVEGEVVDVADRRRTVYINFGRVWREDFTVLIERRSRSQFDSSTIDLLALKGRRVRVRGWIEESGGPMIKVTHPEQIEVLMDTEVAAEAGTPIGTQPTQPPIAAEP